MEHGGSDEEPEEIFFPARYYCWYYLIIHSFMHGPFPSDTYSNKRVATRI